MDKFKSKNILGGIPRVLDDLRHATGQDGGHGIYQSLNNILGSFGTDFVVQGCEVTGSVPSQSLSEGWIYLGGELLKVDAVSGILDTSVDFTFTKSVTFKASGLKDLQSGGTANTYEQNRGVLSGGAGALNVLTGDRFKDQFDEWKVFDITGTNANLVSNSLGDGTGTDIALHSAAVSGHLRYKIVGKTVTWSISIVGFEIKSQDAAGTPIFSVVIKNLPWTAKVDQYNSVFMLCTSDTGPVTNTTRAKQVTSSDRIIINQLVFDNSDVALNRAYEWLNTTSMNESNTSATNIITQWTLTGNGCTEIE
tara:strand:+ start:5419 stop:6342 length:924 start_codon:yes stop_codon:yes gene_type:complete